MSAKERKPTAHYQEILRQTAANIRQNHPKLKISDSAVKTVVNEFFDVAFYEYLFKGIDVSLSSFIGKFKSTLKPARKAINPKTQEKIDVPERVTISFKISRKADMDLNPHRYSPEEQAAASADENED